ncbi:response regulator transcription factor [Roseateles sp. BYS180W]|uniref:Response regulator transcription factor n=1 Tax=Roseateles rivi TaxID=3299028 RepID=A0ABW7FR29_9BURK
MVRVLIVDDDAEIGALLCAALARHGLQAEHQLSGQGLLKRLACGDVDVLILDRMLPGDDGLSLCGAVRQQHALPILMLTALGDPVDRVVGLYGGADDYMVKPFDVAELVARIKVLMRRQQGEVRQEAWHFAGWALNLSQRELRRADGLLVPLSGAEFRLLLCLLQHKGQVLSRADLQAQAQPRAVGHERSIDLLVSRLRHKLQDDEGRLVRTVRGLGYQLDAP